MLYYTNVILDTVHCLGSATHKWLRLGLYNAHNCEGCSPTSHLMTETDQVIETLCIPNIPKTMANVHHNICIANGLVNCHIRRNSLVATSTV
jgi:hypothetical protein